MILQDTANLKNSIRAFPDKVSVTIGSSVRYAAIHQFSGMTGRNKKVRIPKRQFIPIDENGILTPGAERGVLAALYEHIAETVQTAFLSSGRNGPPLSPIAPQTPFTGVYKHMPGEPGRAAFLLPASSSPVHFPKALSKTPPF